MNSMSFIVYLQLDARAQKYRHLLLEIFVLLSSTKVTSVVLESTVCQLVPDFILFYRTSFANLL